MSDQSVFDLSEKVAIVTGGAGLLGASHCHTLAAAGAHVVAADIRGQAAEELAGQISAASSVAALGLETDVTSPDSAKQMASAAVEAFGRIDILVNNAALDPKFDRDQSSEHTATFEGFPLEQWQSALAVNLTGMFLCAQAVAPVMREAGIGTIINISSTYGLVGPDQRLYAREGQPPAFKPVTYSVTKAGALGLTRYLATYFAGSGIRVNSLTPGGVFANHDQEFVKRYSARTVLGRMAEPGEISQALLFLASDASSYMTGANLVVDGGWTAW